MIRAGAAPHFSDDSESLQADVMRFMAIIAFCLVAILALVRNVEPTEATPQSAPAQVRVVPEQMPAAPDEMAAVPDELPTPPDETPSVPAEVRVAAPEPLPVMPATSKTVMVRRPEPAEPEPPQAAPDPVEAPQTISDAPDPPQSESPKEEGLSLRFASDGDFLRLIARGDIGVFAFHESDIVSLDAGYRFQDAAAPGQVYELLLATIPGLVVDALRTSRQDITAYSWGVTLPGRISGQIERHLDGGKTGQLIIDRYGDVRHVP